MERLGGHILDIKTQLAAQNQNLEEHMRRITIAESRLTLMEDSVVQLGRSVWFAKGAVGLFGFLSCVGGILLTIMALL